MGREVASLQVSHHSSNGVPPFSIVRIILYPFLYEPFLDELNPVGSPTAIFKGKVTALPSALELFCYNAGGS